MRVLPVVSFSRLAPWAAAVALATLALPQGALAANVQTKVENLGVVSLPSTATYSNVFTLATMSGFNAASDTFFDDYLFSVADSSFSSLTATIDLASVFSISNLQVRLYSGTTPTFGTAGPALLQAWSTPVSSGSGTTLVINPTTLGAGNYILEVRGNITGAAGGAYVGGMNFASVSAVPEGDGLALAAAGLSSLLWMRARKRSK